MTSTLHWILVSRSDQRATLSFMVVLSWAIRFKEVLCGSHICMYVYVYVYVCVCVCVCVCMCMCNYTTTMLTRSRYYQLLLTSSLLLGVIGLSERLNEVTRKYAEVAVVMLFCSLLPQRTN